MGTGEETRTLAQGKLPLDGSSERVFREASGVASWVGVETRNTRS